MEQIKAADVAAGLRELADILETGELGELGDELAQGLVVSGVRAFTAKRDEFVAWARALEGEQVEDPQGHWLIVQSMCGEIPVRVQGYAAKVGDSVQRTRTRTEQAEWWVLPAELRGEAVAS